MRHLKIGETERNGQSPRLIRATAVASVRLIATDARRSLPWLESGATFEGEL